MELRLTYMLARIAALKLNYFTNQLFFLIILISTNIGAVFFRFFICASMHRIQ